MRRSITRALLAFALTVASAICVHAACPAAAPGSMYSMTITTTPSCSAVAACPNGPVTLALMPHPSGFFPPAEYDPGYAVQPCDVVEWSFGDGTTQSVTGSNSVTHEYPNPGNYSVRATVSNALGSTIVNERSIVVATSPSRLRFATGPVKVVHPGYESVCTNCVEVREGDYTSVTVTRSLDLSRSTSAEAVAFGSAVRVPLLFAPGETQKTFGVTFPEDAVYSGVQYFPLQFANPTGGTLTLLNESWQPTMVLIDDDPAPFLSIQGELFIREGDSGLTKFSIPVSLTAPMGVDCYASSFFTSGSATYLDYISGGGSHIKAGETTGAVWGWIKGDVLPEGNETFQVRIAPRGTTSDPYFGAKIATVTIVDDDAPAIYATLSPARVDVKVPTVTPIRLTLDIGSPYLGPTTILFTSSNVRVVPVPEPVLIPAGVTKIDVFMTAHSPGAAVIGAVAPGRTTVPAEVVATSARRRAAAH